MGVKVLDGKLKRRGKVGMGVKVQAISKPLPP